jgi:hypothetical protein
MAVTRIGQAEALLLFYKSIETSLGGSLWKREETYPEDPNRTTAAKWYLVAGVGSSPLGERVTGDGHADQREFTFEIHCFVNTVQTLSVGVDAVYAAIDEVLAVVEEATFTSVDGKLRIESRGVAVSVPCLVTKEP